VDSKENGENGEVGAAKAAATKRHKRHKKEMEEQDNGRRYTRRGSECSKLSAEGDKTMDDNGIFKLCDVIRETSFSLHQYLRHGHLEKVYENGLAHRLRKAGIVAVQQFPLEVRDEDGTVLGEYCADLFVANVLIVELKAARALANEHMAQLLGYLRGCNVRHGLLINFGTPKLEIKKFVL